MEQDWKPYYLLFNAISDALASMEAQDFGQAGQILRQAQRDGEEWFLSHPEA
jgi:hypothetical protein